MFHYTNDLSPLGFSVDAKEIRFYSDYWEMPSPPMPDDDQQVAIRLLSSS